MKIRVPLPARSTNLRNTETKKHQVRKPLGANPQRNDYNPISFLTFRMRSLVEIARGAVSQLQFGIRDIGKSLCAFELRAGPIAPFPHVEWGFHVDMRLPVLRQHPTLELLNEL